jgi:type I restriction enzyme R subunit
MANRPKLPVAIQREVLYEARHRCAVCCEPTPLEQAHIVAWCETKDHRAENLIALCANCHSRADKEKWGETTLKKYKQNPCALARGTPAPLHADQKAIVDMIISGDPEALTDRQRRVLISAVAAYLNVDIGQISLKSVTAANSARVRLEMSNAAAKALVEGFRSHDQRLQAFLGDFDLLAVEDVQKASGGGGSSSDTTERGLEDVIVRDLNEGGWTLGKASDYDRAWTVDLAQLHAYIAATQEHLVGPLDLDNDSPTRQKFLSRLQGEIGKRGVIDVLRKGVKHGAFDITLFYGTPSPGNPKAQERFAANRFSVTRQLRYSQTETALALDLALFVNGLPVSTFELKNNLTKQTVEDAIEQYRRDRDPRDRLFEFGRCIVHFAVDDAEVRFCTHLKGRASWFLPFNKGWNDGAGNPPNPAGIKTDYLWKDTLTPSGMTDIIENYAQIVEEADRRTQKKKRFQIFPRYHQLSVVRKLLADAAEHGLGQRYLVQHSAGSGKSNSIAWLSHQLVGLHKTDKPIFGSIVVVTDRRLLDRQIRDTVKQFAQVGAVVGHAEHSGDLRTFIEGGKKIIITTVQKFPYVLDDIGNEHRDRGFAIIIDEAHSSQGGKGAAAVSAALGDVGVTDEDETFEDAVNRIMESRKILANASYFAFTATPKNKTLELFGKADVVDGRVKHSAFHSYTMKQAIQEGFILDVLRSYTPVSSYYHLVKKIEGDPEFDVRRANKKLRRYVEDHDYAIGTKASIVVDHFLDNVIALGKIGGQARAMVVASSVDRALEYYRAIHDCLAERKSPYRAIVAFSGDRTYHGVKVSEATLNGFPSREIEDRIEEDPYRFLVCADKFQTGYDEPLLHTMYVDKPLSGIRAVQTLSRLNRAHPQKHDVFILDFYNDVDTIRSGFAPYYRATILSDETDPNKLHDLRMALQAHEIFREDQIEQLVRLYLGGADRDKLDPILDACVATYKEQLDEDDQVDFKGRAKAFTRTYDYLASILPYSNATWEKLSIFLNFLIPKLPAPKEADTSKGILETIDMDSYRVEKREAQRIQLADEDAEISPFPGDGGGLRAESEVERLSNIIKTFNDLFGNVGWQDGDRIRDMISKEIPQKVSADTAYQNAQKNSDKQNARIEHDKALGRVIIGLMKDDTELFKQFSDNPDFKRWLADTVFYMTYGQSGGVS